MTHSASLNGALSCPGARRHVSQDEIGFPAQLGEDCECPPGFIKIPGAHLGERIAAGNLDQSQSVDDDRL